MITILFITPNFTRGGAEKNILNIINQLDNKHFNIHLIICTSGTGYLNQLNKEIKIHCFKKNSTKAAIIPLYKKLNLIAPNLVFTSAPHLTAIVLIYKKLFNKKFIKLSRIPTLPSNRLGEKSLKTKVSNWLNKKLLGQSTYIITQTPQMREEIVNTYEVNTQHVVVIKNIVDTTTIKKLANEPINLPSTYNYVASGTLYSAKGYDYLIKAFSKHVLNFPTDKLFILGGEGTEQGYTDYLVSMINELNLTDSAYLVGHQSNPYKFYKNADAFVLSSIKEGYPNVVLENMVLGTPILATNCVDLKSTITEDIGIIVNKGSVEALINGLKEIKRIKRYNITINNFNYNKWFKILQNENLTSN